VHRRIATMNKSTLSIKSRNKKRLLVSFSILSLMLAGTTFAAEHDGSRQRTEARQPHLYKLSKLRDRSVQNTAEEQIGRISEIIIDKAGHVRYAVLSHSGTLGMDEKMTALPWDALQIAERGKYYILDVSEEELADVPTFSDDNWPIQPTWDPGTVPRRDVNNATAD
jgi:hypothetical protein